MTKLPEGNNQETIFSIKAFFNNRQKKIDFLLELNDQILKLNDQKHSSEALLLCCCYIEGFANGLYWPAKGSEEKFVRVLKDYGEKEIFACIHTVQLENFLKSKRAGKNGESILKKVADTLDANKNYLHTKDNMLSIVGEVLETSEYEWLDERLWKGTVAAIIYTDIRCQLVHNLFTRGYLSFERMTFNGERICRIDFDFMYPVLQRILKKAIEISLTSGKWYGHDFINNADSGELG